MTTSKRSLLYGRTSLDRNDGQSVNDQLTELRAWAQREGRTVVAERRDDGISASRFARGKERPGWRAVMDAVDRGECDELALWEGSRGSRDLVEWVRLADVCAERAVMVVVRGRTFDPREPEDRERLLNDAVRADYESGKVSQRVARSVRSRAADGRPHGALNYGYRTEYDPTTGKPVRRVPDPERAPFVVEAIDRLLSGESSGSIVRDFLAREVPTHRGGKWNQANLIQMARKPAYAGLRASNVHQLPDDHTATWEPLISREKHDRLLAMLDDPGRRTARNGSHQRHLLAGVARCGACAEGRMRTLTKMNRPGTQRAVVYGCRECKRVSRRAEPVDAYVSDVVIKFLSRLDILDALADPGDTDRAAARAEAARLSRKLADLERALDTDEIDVAAYTRLSASARTKLERAEADARPHHVPDIVLDVAGPDAAARWEATPIPQRRVIVRALFTVTIERSTRSGRLPFDPSTVRIERLERSTET